MRLAAGATSGAHPINYSDFETALDAAHAGISRFGMDGLIYDFAPVPFTPEGEMITPSVFGAREMPSDMAALWCSQGLHQRDPVQRLALGSVQPVYWSYHVQEESDLSEMGQGPVADYLRDYRLARGITMPIHIPRCGSATVTGVWYGSSPRNAEASVMLADFMLFAHGVHSQLLGAIPADGRTTNAVRLSPREQQCILLCADGLSDKQVAFALDRSISTVVMHLQSAMRKLGARNRAQAIARAAHFGLLH